MLNIDEVFFTHFYVLRLVPENGISYIKLSYFSNFFF